MLTFIFTQCRSACPRMAVEIRDAIRAAGDGVEAHAITVDPEHDTPEQAKAWIKRIGFPGRQPTCSWASRRDARPVWERFGIVPIASRASRAPWRA